MITIGTTFYMLSWRLLGPGSAVRLPWDIVSFSFFFCTLRRLCNGITLLSCCALAFSHHRQQQIYVCSSFCLAQKKITPTLRIPRKSFVSQQNLSSEFGFGLLSPRPLFPLTHTQLVFQVLRNNVRGGAAIAPWDYQGIAKSDNCLWQRDYPQKKNCSQFSTEYSGWSQLYISLALKSLHLTRTVLVASRNHEPLFWFAAHEILKLKKYCLIKKIESCSLSRFFRALFCTSQRDFHVNSSDRGRGWRLLMD